MLDTNGPIDLTDLSQWFIDLSKEPFPDLAEMTHFYHADLGQ